ncbi:MAG: c-type cytochrome [Acetobacteraceae bacterium]|jgi:cytochrome c
MSWRVILCQVIVAGAASTAHAQLPFDVPKPAAPSAASLFVSQCGTCHTVEHGAAPRQGPNLAGAFNRKAGTLSGFHYSPGFANAAFVWDATHLDAWLADPQKLIPGAVMLYRQPDPAVRASIIAWLKEQH